MKRTNLNISVCSEFRDIFLMVDFSTLFSCFLAVEYSLFCQVGLFARQQIPKKENISRALFVHHLCHFYKCVLFI